MSPRMRRRVAVAWATLGFVILGGHAARPLTEPQPSARVLAADLPSPEPPALNTNSRVGRVAEEPSATSPVQVRIPSMGVSARVLQVGLRADGAMEIPADPQILGWYRVGAGPNSVRGSMVIAGHVNSRIDGPGVLARLGAVNRGTVIVVTDSRGQPRSYRVSATEQVHKRDLALGSVFSASGAPVLRLITCTGRFLGPGLGYEDNLVVSAVRLG